MQHIKEQVHYSSHSVVFDDVVDVMESADEKKLIISGVTFTETGAKVVSPPKNDYGEKPDIFHVFCSKAHAKDQFLNSFKGVVFDATEGGIIVPAFPGTQECKQDKLNEPTMSVPHKIYPSYEGVLLRVFHFKNRWHVMTHKNIDAFARGSWADKTTTFGETLARRLLTLSGLDANNYSKAECVAWIKQHMDASLDSKFIYYWLLRPTAAERVASKGHCLDDPEAIVSVGKRDSDNDFAMTWYPSVSVAGVNLFTPKSEPCASLEELGQKLDESNPDHQSGYMCLFEGQDNNLKIMSHQYSARNDLRSNTPSPLLAYLKTRSSDPQRLAFLKLYPELEQACNDIEADLSRQQAARNDLKTNTSSRLIAYLKTRSSISQRLAFLDLYPDSEQECNDLEADLNKLMSVVQTWLKETHPIPASVGCCEHLQQKQEIVFKLMPCGHSVHKNCLTSQSPSPCKICKKRVEHYAEQNYLYAEKDREKRDLLNKLVNHFPHTEPSQINRDNISLFLSQHKYAICIYNNVQKLKNRAWTI
jgi:hypothetical protein